LKWFIANNKQWKNWAKLIDSFHTYFLPRDFFTRLADQVRQRKQGFSESFKGYMIDMQTMVRPLNCSAKETLKIIKENCTPSLRILLRAYKVSDLYTLMILAGECIELEKEGEAFAQENKFSKTKSTPTPVVLLGVRESRRQERRMLPADGICPAISTAERRAGVARCYLSTLTGKLIEEEQQLSVAVTTPRQQQAL